MILRTPRSIRTEDASPLFWREGAKIQFLPSSGARESACRDVTMEDFRKSRATPHTLHKCAASRNLPRSAR